MSLYNYALKEFYTAIAWTNNLIVSCFLLCHANSGSNSEEKVHNFVPPIFGTSS